MVIHSEINYRKKEQSLAEVQKTIALYDFALVREFRAGDGEKRFFCCLCLSALQLGIIKIIKIIVIIGIIEIISKILPEHQTLAPLGAALRDE